MSGQEASKQETQKSQEKNNIKMKCDYCKKVYVKPSYYVKHMKNTHNEEYRKKTDKINKEDAETELLKSVSVMIQAAEIEEANEATEIAKEFENEDSRLGFNFESVIINLEDIESLALPTAMEEVETNDEAPNSSDVMDLFSLGSKEMEEFVATTKESLSNEILVELATTDLPPPNSAASHFMSKSLNALQIKLLLPVAESLNETEEDNEEAESVEDEVVEEEVVIEKVVEEEVAEEGVVEEEVVEQENAKDMANMIVQEMANNAAEEPTEEKETKKDENGTANQNVNLIKCRRCKFTTGSIRNLIKHTNRKHTCQYKCVKCKETFIFKATLNKHVLRTHPEIEVVKAPEQCNKECKMKEEVLQHKESIIDKREKMIEKLTNKLENLQRVHEATKKKHADVLKSNTDKRKLCEENNILKKEAVSNAELVRGLQARNLNLEKELENNIAITESDKHHTDFKCDQCGWKTNSKQFLKGHMTSHVATGNRTKLLKCKECNFTSKNTTSFNDHMKEHTIMFSCGEQVGNGNLKCMGMFKTQQEVNNHRKTSHGKRPQFQCNKCEKAFASHDSLLQHAQTKHEESSRLPVGQDDRHLQQERVKYACTNCPAEFKKEADLKVHATSHIFTILCNQCEEKFECNDDLNHHMRTNHNGFTSEKRMCRYFKQGRCTKGSMCLFSHEDRRNTGSQGGQWNQTGSGTQPQACKRGPRCVFYARGNCFYSHKDFRQQHDFDDQDRQIGRGEQEKFGMRDQEKDQFRMQNQEQSMFRRRDQEQGLFRRRDQDQEHFRRRDQNNEQFRRQYVEKVQTPCHFQEKCWYPDTCKYSHEDFGDQQEFLENY